MRMKFFVLGVVLVAGLQAGCDSKPTPATGPPPPPPAGHQNFATQKTRTPPPTSPTTPAPTDQKP